MFSTTGIRPTASIRRYPFFVLFSAWIFAILLCESSSAIIISFDSITSNGVGSPGIAEDQLFVEALDVAGDASFRFFNTGPDASNISEIYFDDGSLLGISTIIDSPPTVDFEEGASPGNLPSGNSISPAFEVTAGFLAEAGNPSPKKGVAPLEEVTIIFDMQGTQTFQSVLDELADGRLRIGIHVTAFDNGASESLVNVPIPEPATLSLMLLGLTALNGYPSILGCRRSMRRLLR